MTVTPMTTERENEARVLRPCTELNCKKPARYFVEYDGTMDGDSTVVRKGFCEDHASDWMKSTIVSPAPSPTGDSEAGSEVERLRRDCAELYQVLGTLDELVPDVDRDVMVKALDNAVAAADGRPRPHDDLLPFILQTLQPARAQSPQPTGMKICPNCNDANSHGDYEGPTCDVCHGEGSVPIAQSTNDERHYLSAILHRMNTLYDMTEEPRLREQISDEVSWLEEKLGVAE